MIKNLNEHIKYSDLKVGQKVTLRNLNWYNYFKDGYINNFVPSMKEYLNKTASIVSINLDVNNSYVHLDIDNSYWKYGLEMFEKIDIKEPKRTLNNQNISNSDLKIGQILEVESLEYLTDKTLKLQTMFQGILNLANEKVTIKSIGGNSNWVRIEESNLLLNLSTFKPINLKNVEINVLYTKGAQMILKNSIYGIPSSIYKYPIQKTQDDNIFKSSMSKVSLKSKNKIKLLKNY